MWLLQEAESSDAQVVRRVVGALGKWDDLRLDDVLVRLWQRWPALRAAVAEAMGKCGGGHALEVLTHLDEKSEQFSSEHPTFSTIVQRSLLQLRARLERTPKKWHVLEEVKIPKKTFIRLHTRSGLELLLFREMQALGVQGLLQPIPGAVDLYWEGPLSLLFQARLFAHMGFLSPPEVATNASLAQDAITTESILLQLGALSEVAGWVGPPPFRYRLVRLEKGHQRGWIRTVAHCIQSTLPAWRNDPVQSDWEVWVDKKGRVEVVPRGVDSRFAYHEKDVPAASHPPLAAALAFVMKPRHGEGVWDPFAGSGTELIEVGLRWREKQLHLVGSDLSKDALQAAQHNAARANVTISWTLQDALQPPSCPIHWIVTNPPLGRRVARGKVRALLQAFLAHAAQVLPSQGHLVWVSPFPKEHQQQANLLGMQVKETHPIDMNGFFAELQVLQKR